MKSGHTGYLMVSQTSQSLINSFDCPMCEDLGFIHYRDTEGHLMFKKCECFARKQIKRRLEYSGINQDKQNITLEAYKPYDDLTMSVKKIAEEYIKTFDNTKTWLTFLGQSGSGKTTLSIAIGLELINRENPVRVVYMPYIDTMRKLKACSRDNEYYEAIRKPFFDADFLIIDDLFKDRIKNSRLIKRYNDELELSEADTKHINPIIDYRYLNKKNTIISTECNFYQLIELDEALAYRISEMSGNGGLVLEFNSKKYNYRLGKGKILDMGRRS